MLKLLLSAVFLLLSLFSLMIVFVIVFPYDSSQVEAFMSSSENCAGVCLLGIQPGISTLREARQELENNLWVTDIHEDAPGNGYAQMTWAWTGLQPAVIDASRVGRITFYWDEEDNIPLPDKIVETISIYTEMRIYSVNKWLGETELGAANLRPDSKIGYSVIYDIEGGMLNLSAELPCPSSLMAYWNAKTRITISIGRQKSLFVSPLDLASICEDKL